MKYPIELYCMCGVKANYTFQHQQSATDYKALFEREHAGPGHEVVSASRYRREVTMKQRAS